MFGMKKGLKYIKLVGRWTGAEPAILAEDRRLTLLGPVTMVDEAGEQLHFKSLYFGNRTAELGTGEPPTTFHILRYLKNGEFHGAVFALSSPGRERVYYPDEAWHAVRTLGLSASLRGTLLRQPATVAVFGVGGGCAVFLLAGTAFGLAGAIAAAALWATAWLFPAVATRRYVGAGRMDEILRAEGFVPAAAAPAKY